MKKLSNSKDIIKKATEQTWEKEAASTEYMYTPVVHVVNTDVFTV